MANRNLCKNWQNGSLDLGSWRIFLRQPRWAATPPKRVSNVTLCMVHGEMALAVTPSGATAFAIETVIAFMAALHAEQAGDVGGGVIAARLEMLMIRPHFCQPNSSMQWSSRKRK
ncbi:hypothetical protein WH162_13265 [Gluconobacter albidus]|nr:hypothetical protein BBA71_12585 [Acetobacter pasteurianus]